MSFKEKLINLTAESYMAGYYENQDDSYYRDHPYQKELYDKGEDPMPLSANASVRKPFLKDYQDWLEKDIDNFITGIRKLEAENAELKARLAEVEKELSEEKFYCDSMKDASMKVLAGIDSEANGEKLFKRGIQGLRILTANR